MTLIIGKKDIRSSFEKIWTNAYVPGLLQYAEKSKKKIFKDIYNKLDEAGTLRK